MANTEAKDVIDSFESSFTDKQVLPESLEIMWLKKAIGRYSVELDELNFDDELLQFNSKLDQYVIDTLAQFMLQMYQERQVSIVNKRVSITGKDLGIDGSNGTKTSEKAHLEYISWNSSDMIEKQKPAGLV